MKQKGADARLCMRYKMAVAGDMVSGCCYTSSIVFYISDDNDMEQSPSAITNSYFCIFYKYSSPWLFCSGIGFQLMLQTQSSAVVRCLDHQMPEIQHTCLYQILSNHFNFLLSWIKHLTGYGMQPYGPPCGNTISMQI